MKDRSPNTRISISRRFSIRLNKDWKWDNHQAMIWWISAFLAFGPFSHFLFGFSWMYSLGQGLFVATFQVSFTAIIYWMRSRIRKRKHSTA